jgi:hypothetical protein
MDGRNPEKLKGLLAEDATLRTLFNIANEYAEAGKYQQAIIYYRHYIERCMFEPHEQEELMCALWRCARWMEQVSRVHDSNIICEYGLGINSNYAELWRQLAWNHRDNREKHTYYTVKANDCQLFPHLYSEDRMYQPTCWNVLRPGANGDLVMLSAVTSQLKRCILYTECPEVGRKLEGVIEVKSAQEWEQRNRSYPDFIPSYPSDDLQEPIIETICRQAGVPAGPMKLKE